MKSRGPSKHASIYLALMVVLVLVADFSLGYLLTRQSKAAFVTLLQTRMLDISNTAAAMIDGDVLKTVTPDDKGTEGYKSIMRALTYFQDNVDLKYIYCVRDMGNGNFTFGLDPTVKDPGEFGSPIVSTDALRKASTGIPAADEKSYEDEWGTFYSAYTPVFDSNGEVAGIVAVDFSAEWYNRQLSILSETSFIVGIVSLLAGGCIVIVIVTKNKKRLALIEGQLSDLKTSLIQEMSSTSTAEDKDGLDASQSIDDRSLDSVGKQIQSMRSELSSQIAHVHGQAYRDGLTGVKSRQAYLEMEESLDKKLSSGETSPFAIVVCDVNELKNINDTLGHKAGDEHIRQACKMICDIFDHSPVYRVGGDEFAVVLTGRDYENRVGLMHELHKRSKNRVGTREAVVSGGLADFVPDQDTHVNEVFERADAAMYKEKALLKSLSATPDNSKIIQMGQDLSFDGKSVFNARKTLLIADDDVVSREKLGDLLADDYDILYASDGAETLDQLHKHTSEVALVILDLHMPNITGREVIKEMQDDEALMAIPVIMLTVDQDAELDCLKLGAMDFVPKPYPNIEIVKTRIAKCIELSVNRDLVKYTQQDKLTGLLNYDYFIRYVNIFDQQKQNVVMDAVVCDINKFRLINRQYGHQSGDLVLRNIGIGIKQLARKTGGFGCRKGGDLFLLYCPHQDGYEQMAHEFIEDMLVEEDTKDKVELRFGVFVDARREPNVEERFACAKIAADGPADESDKMVRFYTI